MVFWPSASNSQPHPSTPPHPPRLSQQPSWHLRIQGLERGPLTRGFGVRPGRAGIYSSRLSLHGPGCERGRGEGACSLGVGSGQVKQAEVRGRGPPSPRECLDDVILGRGVLGEEAALCFCLTSVPGQMGNRCGKPVQMQPLAGFPGRCARLSSSRLGRSLLPRPRGTGSE